MQFLLGFRIFRFHFITWKISKLFLAGKSDFARGSHALSIATTLSMLPCPELAQIWSQLTPFQLLSSHGLANFIFQSQIIKPTLSISENCNITIHLSRRQGSSGESNVSQAADKQFQCKSPFRRQIPLLANRKLWPSLLPSNPPAHVHAQIKKKSVETYRPTRQRSKSTTKTNTGIKAFTGFCNERLLPTRTR